MPKSTRLPKTCQHCGKEYLVKPSGYSESKYCSNVCKSEEHKHRFKGEGNPHFLNAGNRVCIRCGVVYHSYNKTRKYCSKACYSKSDTCITNARKGADAIRGKGNGCRCKCKLCGRQFFYRFQRTTCVDCEPIVKRQKRNQFTCIVCGKAFHNKVRKKTCSRACQNQWQTIRQQAEKSHLWQGGKTSKTSLLRNSHDYDLWRTSVFDRDDYTCQLCSQRGGKLTAHHIQMFSKNHLLRLIPQNGITLCRKCHSSIRHKESLYEDQFYAITGGVKFVQLELL